MSSSIDVAYGRMPLFDLRHRGLTLPHLHGDYETVAQAAFHYSAPRNQQTQQQQPQPQQPATETNRAAREVHMDPMLMMLARAPGISPNRFAAANAVAVGRGGGGGAAAARASPSPTRNNNGNIRQRHSYLRRLVADANVTHQLQGHAGCINSIEFNASATILLTGSDDCQVGLYRTTVNSLDAPPWSRICMVPTAHTRNIFNAKFMPFSNDASVVSCALDGATVLTTVHPSGGGGGGGAPPSRIIDESHHLCSNIATSALDPNVVYVTRGGGGVAVLDVRAQRARVGEFSISSSLTPRPCNGITTHPHYQHLLAVGSDNPFIYFCDMRALPPSGGDSSTATAGGAAATTVSPTRAGGAGRDASFLAVTNHLVTAGADGIGGLNFSDRGDQIVCSYRSCDVVSYEWTTALPSSNRRRMSERTANDLLRHEQNTCRYASAVEAPARAFKGRENDRTMFKEATFVLNDSMVASGGDCGNVFFWDAVTGQLLKKVRSDGDIINGVLAHPALPSCVVACGIDSTAKVITFEANPNRRRAPRRRPRHHRRFAGGFGNNEEEDDSGNENQQNINNNNNEEDVEEADEDFNPSSTFGARDQLLEALFGGRVGRFGMPPGDDEDDEEDQDDVDDEDDEGAGAFGDPDFDFWGGAADERDLGGYHGGSGGGRRGQNDDDDDDDDDDDEMRMGDRLQRRELLVSSLFVLRQPIEGRGTLQQLCNFFRHRTSALRSLAAAALQVNDDSEDDEDSEEILDDESGSGSNDSSDNDGDDDREPILAPRLDARQQQQQQQQEEEAENAEEPTSTIPEITVERPHDQEQERADVETHSLRDMAREAARRERSTSRQRSASPSATSRGGDSDSNSNSSEDEDEDDDSDYDIFDFENADDDTLVMMLIDALQPTTDLIRSIITRRDRSDILSTDPVAPLIRRAADPRGPPTPLIELAEAMLECATCALELCDSQRVLHLGPGARQAWLTPWIRVHLQRAILRAAVGDLDGAMEPAMLILNHLDDGNVGALGLAVGVVRARLARNPPEVESVAFIDALAAVAAGIVRSSSAQSRQQARQLQARINALREQTQRMSTTQAGGGAHVGGESDEDEEI